MDLASSFNSTTGYGTASFCLGGHMSNDDAAKPDGEASSKVTRKAGKPVSSSTSRRRSSAARADLDARHERITLPRKPMGPPLSTEDRPKSRGSSRRSKAAEVEPTDPTVAKKSKKTRKRS
jgi:hypothetical protein